MFIYLIEIEINNVNIIYNVYAKNNNFKKISALNFHLSLLGLKPYVMAQNQIIGFKDIKEFKNEK